ncbi:MAG: response regulator [Deltaproteobacteria bacterium]|nr:response regulator [Deltaproteobacteria bacterium]
MASPPLVRVVILETQPHAKRRLAAFIDVLDELGIEAISVETTREATPILFRHRAEPQAVVVDLAGDAPGSFVSQLVGELRTVLPFMGPVVVTSEPSTEAVILAFRAGAGDVIDLASESRSTLFACIERMSSDYVRRSGKSVQEGELRSVLDEFLRDLVQTERRAMDLEDELASALGIEEETDFGLEIERQPSIMIVDADRAWADKMTDRLEDSGLIAYAYTNGEEAVHHAEALATKGEPIDMVVVDQSLPGIDGLETIRRLKDPSSGAPCFLMTKRSSAQLAESAADLGVSGYIVKPIPDLPRLINRLREQAIESLSRNRQTTYLERIKERHQSVLQRYRALTIEAELPPDSELLD